MISSSYSAKRKYSSGFTLLELLIAITIFAILSTAVYGGLNSVLKSREVTARAAEDLQKLQLAVSIMQRDFTQLLNLNVRDEYGDVKPPIMTQFSDEHIIEFTRAGWRNPTGQLRSTIQRVTYSVEEKTLYREYWTHLYRGPQEQPIRAPLYKGVNEVTLEFQDDRENWHDTWPPLNVDSDNLPIAIKVTFELEGGIEFSRIFVPS